MKTSYLKRQNPANYLDKKYNKLPFLAKWKAIILEYGVDTETNLLQNFPKIENYKTKYRRKIPRVTNFKFIDTSDDYSIIPAEIIISAGNKKSLVKIGYRKTSPLLLNQKGRKIFLTDKQTDKKIPLDLKLVKKRPYSNTRLPKKINYSSPFLSDFVQIVGIDRIGILAFEGCWHWISKRPCKFCDANPKRKGCQSSMPTLNALINYKFKENDWWEANKKNYLSGIKYAFKYLLKTENIKPHQHLQLMAGNLIKTEKVWDICLEISQTINKIKPISSFDSYLNIAAPRKNTEKYLKSAKEEMGFRQIQFNLEVIGEKYFSKVCPGKSSAIGYHNTIETMKKAVKIFGAGNVRSNFVLGAQPVKILLRGIKELAKYGIVSDYSIFVPKSGTSWGKKQPPTIETVIYFTRELAKIYKQNNFKGIYCSLSSRSNIIHEVINNQ